jgi:hypothetical protein
MLDSKKSDLETYCKRGSSRREAPARGGAGAQGEVSPKDGWTNVSYAAVQNAPLR